MGLVEKIRAIRGMGGLSPKTKDMALKDLLEPYIDGKHKVFKAETLGAFKREYQRAPRYLKDIIQHLYGPSIIQKAHTYFDGRVPVDETTDITLDLRGLSGDSPDVGRLENRPPR